MEANKEQQPKHTAEPWILHNDNQHDQTHKSGWFCGDDKPFGYLLSEEDFNHAAKCVNALEGIEDPEKFVKIALDIKTNPKTFIDQTPPGRQRMWLRMIEQHEELLKYKTACEQINKDNPMAVAESLGEIISCLKWLSTLGKGSYSYPTKEAIVELSIELLTKLQEK